MLSPRQRNLRAGLLAASALFCMTLSPKLLLPALGAEPFDPDSGWGIYSDTREYASSDLLPFEPDSGDGIYSDTRTGVRYYAAAPSVDADSGDGIYSDTGIWDGADAGEGIYSDTSDWDSDAGGDGEFDGASSDPAAEAGGTGADGAADDEGLFSLFDDAEDSEGVESAPVTAAASTGTSDEKKFDWWGHLSASGGMTFQLFPEGSMSPFATMTNTLGFTAKPFDDMVVRGSFYSEFPEFNFELTTLYFDYIMNDLLYITAGKTGTSWGNSRIFDTNLLDDEGDGKVVNPYTDETATGNRFDAILTLPVLRGEIQGVGMYSIGDELTRDNLSLAAKIQYPIGPVSLELFGRKWATSDEFYMHPAVGASLTTDIFRNHVNLWGMTHFSPDDIKDLDFKPGISRFVGGVSRIVETNGYGKFGLAAEYQLTYDPDKEEDERMTHDVGLSIGWSHALGSPFSPVIRWWYNPVSRQGYLLPSLTFTGLRHVDITLTVPYIFGGATYNNGKVSWSSTPDEPLVMFGLVFSLSVPY